MSGVFAPLWIGFQGCRLWKDAQDVHEDAVLNVFQFLLAWHIQCIPCVTGIEGFKHELTRPTDDLQVMAFYAAGSCNHGLPDVVKPVAVGCECCRDVDGQLVDDFKAEADGVLASEFVVDLLPDGVDPGSS